MHLSLAIDENFNQVVIRALLRREPELNVLSVQQAGLRGLADPSVLEWAANLGRVLLSHDRNTMPGYFYNRIAEGRSSPGLFIVPDTLSIVEELILVATCSIEDEWRDQCVFLPLLRA